MLRQLDGYCILPTSVINIKDAPSDWQTDPQYVYIGRKGKGLSGRFGNPFKLDNEKDRLLVLSRYKNMFYRLLNMNEQFFEEVMDLNGKTLVCFCKPRDCHGDVIAEFVNGVYGSS